jgi:hypothetical protein
VRWDEPSEPDTPWQPVIPGKAGGRDPESRQGEIELEIEPAPPLLSLSLSLSSPLWIPAAVYPESFDFAALRCSETKFQPTPDTRGSPSFRASSARPGIQEASAEARAYSTWMPAFAGMTSGTALPVSAHLLSVQSSRGLAMTETLVSQTASPNLHLFLLTR